MENDATFIAPEGLWSMSEQHIPPIIQSHLPSTQQLYPTKLSTITVKFPAPKGGAQGFTSLLGGGGKAKESDKDKSKDKKAGYEDSVSSSEGQDDGPSDLPTDPDLERERDPSPLQPLPASLFSAPESPLNKKKSVRRPKHNIRTTSSSFVTRIQSVEGLNKLLTSKVGDNTFLFYNAAKSFFWTEVATKSKDPLVRITFAAHPTCHSVNATTASHSTLDIVIGFSTGDLIWFDPLSSRYVRLNKGGCITSSPCTAVHWVPSSPSLFMVSHKDGSIIVYDKEREDSTFAPRNPAAASKAHDVDNPSNLAPRTSEDAFSTESTEWDSRGEMLVTPGPSGLVPPGGSKEKILKNPVSHWRVSRKAIYEFAFSPDVRHVAVGGEDGQLRVIDALNERLMDTYASYFGSLTCVAWSPDGRFILAGGQDDLLTIFSPFEQRVIARCQGHSSFVSGIAFDELKCDGRTYRFASVGEDNKLIMWDFSGGALHRPKLQAGHHARMSLSSTISLALGRRGDIGDRSTLHLPPTNGNPDLVHFHPAPSRNEVAVLQPVLTKTIDGDLLSGVSFLATGVFTISRAGLMRLWTRPIPKRSQQRNRRDSASSPIATGPFRERVTAM